MGKRLNNTVCAEEALFSEQQYSPSPYLKAIAEKVPEYRRGLCFDQKILRQRLNSQNPEVLKLARLIAGEVSKIPADPLYAPTRPRALVCGGFVRDAVAGLEPNDLDIHVYGVSQDKLQELIERLFPDKVTVFRALKVEFKKEFVIENFEIDVGIVLRLEEKGERMFEEADPSISPEEGAALGDYTINSILYDPLSKEVLDYLGGFKDLKDGVLRLCDPEHYPHYPMLVYRGVQLAARTQTMPDSTCLRTMKAVVNSGDLDEYHAGTRVREELNRLFLKAPYPSIGFELCRELGIIKRYFPELDELVQLSCTGPDIWSAALERLDNAAITLRRSECCTRRSHSLNVLLSALTLGLPEEKTRSFLASCGYGGELTTRSLLCSKYFSEIFSIYPHYVESPKKTVERTAAIVEKKAVKRQAALGPKVKLGNLSIKAAPRQASKPKKANEYHKRVRRLLRLAHPAAWNSLHALAQSVIMEANSANAQSALEAFRREIEANELHKVAKDLLSTEELMRDVGLGPGFHIGFIKGEVNRRRGELLYPNRALDWVKENSSELLKRAKEAEALSLLSQ